MPDSDRKPIEAIVVCTNRRYGGKPSCAERGSLSLADFLESEIKRRNLPVSVRRIVCLSHCNDGPTVRLAPGGRFLLGPDRRDLADLLDAIEDGTARLLDE